MYSTAAMSQPRGSLFCRAFTEIQQTSRGYEIVVLGFEEVLPVNGRRLLRAPLRSGDRIRLGSTEFTWRRA